MEKTILVKAKPGKICPSHIPGRAPITDKQAVEVPNSTFYRHLVRDGSLVVQQPAAEPKKSTK